MNDTDKKTENSKYQAPIARYEEDFSVTEAYRDTLPDMQNTQEVKGLNVPIMQVGVHNFKLPLKILSKNCDVKELEASITATVSLSAKNKGINMSRIIRSFYLFEDRIFTPDLLEEILQAMKKELNTSRARIKISFSYPLKQKSLRSNLEGWQYYNCSYEGFLDDLNRFRKLITFDFVYSSACPCSSELGEHARRNRNVYCIPHSQRSKARVRVEVAKEKSIFIEDLQKSCVEALKTETQVMVKREDEQAFAELNGVYVKFVEDAARQLFAQLDKNTNIIDFEVACIHLESLHSHDAVSVLCKGKPGGFNAGFSNFKDLVC